MKEGRKMNGGKRRIGWGILVWMVAMLSTASTPYAQDDVDDRGSFALILENDFIANTDKAYTNGLFFTWSKPWIREEGGTGQEKDVVFRLTDRLSLTPAVNRERRKAFSIGQALYAPDDIKTEVPDPDDFPYAGILTGKINVQYQNDRRADGMGLLLGLIGPSSQGEWVQKRIHDLIGVSDPKGWDYQLKDEPLINLSYIHKWKLYDSLTMLSGKDIGFDMTAYSGADLGNLMTDVNAGAIVRFGNGANRFPSSPFKGSVGFIPDIGYSQKYPFIVNLIAGVEASWVLHSIVLDGNTFKDSASLDREPFVANVFGGFGMGMKGFWASLIMVTETEVHEEQDEPFTYGSFIVGRTF